MKGKIFGRLHGVRAHIVFLNLLLASIAGVLLLLCPPVCAQKNEKDDEPPRVTGARQIEAATRLDYLFDGQTAIRLLPTEMVIRQGVTRAEWSPDGHFVLAACAPAVIQPTSAVMASIALWDKKRRSSVEVWSRRLTFPVLNGPTQWLGKEQVGLVRWRWMEADENGSWSIKEGIVWVNAAKGVAREVDLQPGDIVSLSPMQSGGIILHGSLRLAPQSIRVIAPDGSVGPNVPMPNGTRECYQTRWQPDGKQFCMELSVPVEVQDKKDDAKNKVQGVDAPSRKQWFAVDMTQPRVLLLDKEPGDVPAVPGRVAAPNALPRAGESNLRVKSTPTTLKQGNVETQIHSLWLETGGTKPMSALLCVDGERAQIAPSGDAVLYLAQTGVWVTTLARIPRPFFATAVLAPHQDDVRYRAWTLAQAVRMWSAAHKGVLPAPDEALAALQSLMPDGPLYEGFRYVWTGGALPASARPAETVVAEIIGPGGWVQIFADGHTAWKSSD